MECLGNEHSACLNNALGLAEGLLPFRCQAAQRESTRLCPAAESVTYGLNDP